MATTTQKREQANRNRLKAMSHPLRAKILKRLIEKGSLSPAEVGREIDIDSSLASHHLKRLVALDCAELAKEERAKGTGAISHIYRPIARHLVDTDEWESLPDDVRQTLLPEFFQPIVDDFTSSVQAGILGATENFHITRTPMVLDQESLLEGLEILEKARLDMSELEKRSALRRRATGAKSISVSSSIAYFEVPPIKR